MADKLLYIPNEDTQNYPFCRLQLVVLTFGHSEMNLSNFYKSPQSFKANERKRYYKTLGTSVINNPLSPPPC